MIHRRRRWPAAGDRGLWLGLGLLVSGAAAAADLSCAAAGARTPLPDPSDCLAEAGLALLPAEREEAFTALLDSAREATASGHFERTEPLLDCAAAQLQATEPVALRLALIRQRGVLDYRRERMPQALVHFRCALQLAESTEDREEVARELNAVGSTLRRLGDYRGALEHLTRALQLQRSAAGPVAAVLNNIGDVYRALGEPEQALQHYAQAREAYRERDEPGHAAHVAESMAVVQLDLGQAEAAAAQLEQALDTYRQLDRRDYAIRVHGWLIRAALAQGRSDDAEDWRSAGEALASSHRLSLPLSFEIQAARSQRITGQARVAATRLQQALQPDTSSHAERAEAFEELSAAQQALGDWPAALASLRQAQHEERAHRQASHDRALGWLRTRFEAAEQERRIAALEADNRMRAATLAQRTLQLLLSLACAAAALLLLWLLLQRRRQRERIEQAARLARKEQEAERYRRDAALLEQDRQRLRALLDSRSDALCLIDPDGRVLAANQAARSRLGGLGEDPQGQLLPALLGLRDESAFSAALERLEDGQAQVLAFADATPSAGRLRLSPWSEGDGMIVVELADDRAPASAAAALPGGDSATTDPVELFRRQLVELMLASVEAWERSSGRSRLDLAEDSRIWRVAIDDGRLRARSMERYLSLPRLPRQPRWRDVLRTAYHVLERCPIDDATRVALQAQVDAVLAHTRRRALG